MSQIDGRKVTARNKPEWEGLVVGDSHLSGQVRVSWSLPWPQTGVHHINDLEVLDEPPSQEDLTKMYYG